MRPCQQNRKTILLNKKSTPFNEIRITRFVLFVCIRIVMIPGSQCQQSVLHLDNATLKEAEMKGVEARDGNLTIQFIIYSLHYYWLLLLTMLIR